MGKTRHQLAIVVTAVTLILAASAGWTAWHLARAWFYPRAPSAVAPAPQEPVTVQQPSPPHVITRDDFLGAMPDRNCNSSRRNYQNFGGWMPTGEMTLTTRMVADTASTPLDRIQSATPYTSGPTPLCGVL